jgi:hypothetical protein
MKMTSRTKSGPRYCQRHSIKLVKRVGGVSFCERCRYDEAMEEKSDQRVTQGP